MPYLRYPITAEGPLARLMVAAPNAGKDARWYTTDALIDTGASHTIVEEGAMTALGLKPHGEIQNTRFNSVDAPRTANTYRVSLALRGSTYVLGRDLLVMAGSFSGNRFHAILGRDFLDQMMLVYDGKAGTATLTY